MNQLSYTNIFSLKIDIDTCSDNKTKKGMMESRYRLGKREDSAFGCFSELLYMLQILEVYGR